MFELKKSLHRIAGSIAPNLEQRLSEARWLRQHARELRRDLIQADSVEKRVRIALSPGQLRSSQKPVEILSLLKEVESLSPKTLCEIGADKGGTLALFASVVAPNARILSLDIHYPGSRARVYRMLAQKTQSISCLEADSHVRDTLRKVQLWLHGQQLDFLFIDGDHSYDGVKSDYEMYGPLVRPGGIIAFHDICPDFRTRHGIKTSSDVGEVPRFWCELKQRGVDWTEFVEDPEQDGYGIGIVRV